MIATWSVNGYQFVDLHGARESVRNQSDAHIAILHRGLSVRSVPGGTGAQFSLARTRRRVGCHGVRFRMGWVSLVWVRSA